MYACETLPDKNLLYFQFSKDTYNLVILYSNTNRRPNTKIIKKF